MRKIRISLLLVLCVVGWMPLHASKRILVDLTHQVAIAYQDGKVLFYGRISSGKPGRETPTGSFYVREKDVDHVSNLWPKPNGGARMPYMLRITRDGVAMHLGHTPNYPASHGCIRMQDGFAQRMFAWADKWVKVDIVGHAPVHSPPVALPAFAQSREVLRRSIGGGNGSALDVLSSNPKVNGSIKHPHLVIQEDTYKTTPMTRQDAPPRHIRAVDVLSSNPKRRQRIKKTRHKQHPRKPLHKQHNRHPNPLQVLSTH